MSVHVSISTIRKLRLQVGIVTSLLITVFVGYFWLYRSVSLIDSIFGWLISNLSEHSLYAFSIYCAVTGTIILTIHLIG